MYSNLTPIHKPYSSKTKQLIFELLKHKVLKNKQW